MTSSLPSPENMTTVSVVLLMYLLSMYIPKSQEKQNIQDIMLINACSSPLFIYLHHDFIKIIA